MQNSDTNVLRVSKFRYPNTACYICSMQYLGTNVVMAHHVWYPNTASIKARNIRVPIFIEYLKFGTRILQA